MFGSVRGACVGVIGGGCWANNREKAPARARVGALARGSLHSPLAEPRSLAMLGTALSLRSSVRSLRSRVADAPRSRFSRSHSLRSLRPRFAHSPAVLTSSAFPDRGRPLSFPPTAGFTPPQPTAVLGPLASLGPCAPRPSHGIGESPRCRSVIPQRAPARLVNPRPWRNERARRAWPEQSEGHVARERGAKRPVSGVAVGEWNEPTESL